MKWIEASPILLMIGVVILAAPHFDGNLPGPAPHIDDNGKVKPIPVIAESDYWLALATCVEKSTFGTLQQHTDHLLQIIDLLKKSGSITDDARVAEWRVKRVEITDANRSSVASTLRGKR
jgi:hypothetical protein